MNKENMENFELSLNQKRCWFLENEQLNRLYNLVTVSFNERPDVEELNQIVREIVHTHETLSSALFFEETVDVPLQTPGYFQDVIFEVLPAAQYSQWMEQSSNECEPNSKTSQPIGFYVFVDNNKVERLAVKALSFWTDVFGCFKLVENIQRLLKKQTILTENDEDFVIHRNFAAWQNELIQEEDNEGVLFWSNYEMDLVRKNVPFGEGTGARFLPHKLTLGTVNREQFADESSEDTKIRFLQAFIEYLQCYRPTGLTLGYTRFSRIYEELNETVGLISKTLPLEVSSEMLTAEKDLKSILAEKLDQIGDWSDYYGADYLDKSRSLQRFQTNFQFIDLDEVKSIQENLSIQSVFAVQDSFELKLEIVQFEKQLEISVYYDQYCFNEVEIQVIQSQLMEALEKHMKIDRKHDYSERIGGILEQLSAERTEIEGNDQTIYQWIDQQIAQYPERVALKLGDREYAYSELGNRVNAVAHYLASSGLNVSEFPVAILLEDPIAFVVSMLGVMKAGGHFLPLEAKTPVNRLNFILSDSQSTALISNDILSNSLDFSGERINYAEIPVSDEAVEQEIPSSKLAYIIYTSGSTGQPKGVKVGHASLKNYLNWAKSYYPKGNAALFTSFSFDLTLTSILLPLVNGNAIWAPEVNTPIDQIIADMLQDPFVQVIKLTPSHINLMHILPVKSNGAKAFICGGEALSKEQVGYLHNLGGEIKVYNEYGPTEATIGCVVAEIARAPQKVVIGRPISNVQLKIQLEEQPCSVGQPGELWIGGNCLSLGYVNHSEKLNDAFVTINTDKFYKTGDLVRLLPSGDLEFLGRIDEQVKINGYRVELGEIEAQLNKMEGVSNVAVLYEMDETETPSLMAFVEGEKNMETTKLKMSLSEQVPAYMVPSYFYQVEKMPLTANGKLDRKKLLEMRSSLTTSKVPYVAPRNKEEERIASIWSEVLQMTQEKIGIKHRFFEIGGDSIKVIRLVVLLRKVLDYKISVGDVYNNDTIESLVDYINTHGESINVEDAKRHEHKRQVEGELELLKERVLSTNTLDVNNVEDLYPMSDIEKGMVFGYLLNEGTGTYHDQMVFTNRFEAFDINRFEKALNRLSQKHEILRTGFDLSNFETEIQIVYKEVDHSVFFEDLSAFSMDQQETHIKHFLHQQLKKKFNVDEAPLWRMSVFKVGEDSYVFTFEFHHAILDGWSDASFVTELNNLYLKLADTPDFVPKRLKSTYKDFVIQEKMNQSDSEVRDFWKTELSDYERLDLFTEKEELAKFHGSKDHAYLIQLEERAAELGTTVKTISLSAYLMLLQILNSEPEIVSGLVVNNRPNIPDGDKIVGCFLNTVPFKITIDTNTRLDELIRSVHQKTIELKKYEGLSLFAITEICQEKSEHANPFFDAMFNYVDFHIFNEVEQDDQLTPTKEQTSGPALESHERTNTFFDFTVSSTGSVYGLLISATNKLKSGRSIDYVGNLYFKIVDAILSDASLTLGEIQILEDHEIVELTEVLNDTVFNFDTDSHLIDFFETHVHAQGDALALADSDTTLTYAELNARSNQLAHYLRGIFDQNPSIESKNVGVLLQRSVDSVIAMIGIMKAGGCYVPINLEHPTERIQYVFNDANLQVVIGEKALCEKHAVEVNHLVELAVVCSDENDMQVSTNPEKINQLDDVAAIFYTSGSSGQPKGVLQTHRMMRNLIHWDTELSGIENGLKHLQFNSFSFDACIQDVFFALCSGGSLYMVKESSRLDYHQLMREVILNRVEVLFMPFSALNALCSEVDMENLDGHVIKYIISTAEQLLISDALRRFIERNPEIQLRNYYGPSETHIVTSHTMSIALNNLESPSPVGKPIANCEIYLLNTSGKLIPKGVIGEIYIGGENLAAGYLNLPKLTDEKFIDSPFHEGKKLYKTGDRGYWREDNNLIFLGRKDDQIKIRGFRVELGEIEQTLIRNEHVEKVVVLAKKQSAGEYALIAYIQPTNNTTLESSELRAYLKKSLPEYMLPSYFVSMESIPLTNNGKVDKKVLPLPHDFGQANDQVYVAPQTELQHQLVNIWEDLLKREKIGIRNDFFAMGGHSLKVVRLSNRYQKELGVKVALKELFEKVTIEQQCELIDRLGKEEFTPINPVPLAKNYPISDAQRRLWVLSQFEDEAVSYNMPDRIFLDRNINLEAFEKAVFATIERHEILRTVFKENEDGEIRQWVVEPSELKFSIEYLGQNLSAHEVEEYITNDTYKPFDFENGPLIRAAILGVGNEESVFYYNVHHIISDGVSGTVLAQDVMAFYEYFTSEDQKIQPPAELRIQYKDYSAWQLEQIETLEFANHREFWLNQLKGDLPILDLPAVQKRPALKTTNGQTLGIAMDETVTSKLKALCQHQGGTLFTGLLTSLNAVLYRYTGQEDLIVGSPVAGRDHPDLEGQIGFYVNTLALRNTVQSKDTFQELFLRVKENVLSAFEHQMYPFDRLVNELQLPRDTSRNVVFDIMLVHQNGDDEQLDKTQWQTDKIVDLGAKTSKFDVLITTKESNGKLVLLFEYNTDVYAEEMMKRFIVHFTSLISKMVEQPEKAIGTIDYLSTDEREKLVIGLNDTHVDFGDAFVMELFEQQVTKTPQKLAVIDGEQRLTYAELNERSNRLAHEIRRNYRTNENDGEQMNTLRIGVMLERSVDSVVAMFGVMKSGAVYVPLSSKYPTERIAFIIENAAIAGVVCKPSMLTQYPFIQPIDIDQVTKTGNGENPKVINKLNHAAFIIYTSGSTGQPKGVIQSHLMMRNLTSWDISKSGIERDLKHLHYNDFGFDVSIQDCWSPLCAGGSVYLTKEEERIEFASVWNTIVENEIEVISFPFSALHQLILQNESADYSKLKIRHIISAGEQLIVNAPLFEFLTQYPHVKLHNHYGPSESHVVTSHQMAGEYGNLTPYAPIGKPVANTQIYLLDKEGNAVPQGVKGELYIGGDNLGLGYVNLPEETALRFVEHPLLENKKVYRTGDQAIWQLNGELVFLGREDDQVKIRGYRIELQEVERVLQEIPSVEEAVVMVTENDRGEKEMTAYLRSTDTLKLEELSTILKQKIPSQMIPSHFIKVDAFKLTVNGKVDKHALREMKGLDVSSGTPYVAPSTPFEKKIVEIWEEVLQREKIGVNDDFFALGGHSIKAAKVVSKINQEYQSGVKIGHIFSTPTISDLAYNIEFAMNQKNRKSNLQNIKEIEL